jgi:hypothetical protein
MVETGHGTGDNFTGQVMKKKKTCRKTYKRFVQWRLVVDCYLCFRLFTYFLFTFCLITLSLSQAIRLNYGIISEQQVWNYVQ